jgi:hypothetical protein
LFLQDASEWLDSHPGAEKEEYVDKAKEVEQAYIAAREKAQASASSAGAGEAGAAAEDDASGTEGADEGPRVEEVD